MQVPETSQSSIEDPSPADPSNSNNLVSESVQVAAATPEAREEPRERDALDDMIQEAKATGHLVSRACNMPFAALADHN